MGCGTFVMYYQFFVVYKIHKGLKREESSNTLGIYLPTYLPTYRPAVILSMTPEGDQQLF